MEQVNNEEINKKRKEGWIESWLAIEALAVNEEILNTALEEHIKKLANTPNIYVYETKYHDSKYVEKPTKNIPNGYSKVAELKLFAKDLFSIINIVLLYGPSSVEILGPDKIQLKIGDIQNITNILAALVHEFAAAGVGGIIINAEKKK